MSELVLGVKEILQTIPQSKQAFKIRDSYSYAGLSQSQVQALQKQNFKVYRGKVRECVEGSKHIYLVNTDRLSAFDRAITLVPLKGLILSKINEFWFQKLKGYIPTAFIQSVHDRIIKMELTECIKIEVIVRAYLAGSMLRSYQQGQREFCDVKLPNGLKPYSKLPSPIITPTTKAEAYAHDEQRSPKQLINDGTCSEQEWGCIAELALKTFEIGSKVYRSKGWVLADTKYEFGRRSNGDILLIDEVHTPDSSRIWLNSNDSALLSKENGPTMFDKELIRSFLIQSGFSGKGSVPPIPIQKVLDLTDSYNSIYESLSGQTLTLSTQSLDLSFIS
jgi:phosphoribosylaminoimidazole-succinocarboxamide synthase